MIPKTLHYCWFGGKEKPKGVERFLSNWKRKLPDYRIVEWNEGNFDVEGFRFSKEAYAYKKYAFVSDVARLAALCEHGGIYLDTDVEVLKSLDDFLANSAFIGFETPKLLSTALMGAEKGHPWIKALLDIYKTRPFILPDGSLNLEPNVFLVTELTKSLYGLKTDNALQVLDGGLTVYPCDYFSPKNHLTERISATQNTHAIHHFSSSWFSLGRKIRKKCHTALIRLLGERLCERVLARIK